MRCPPLRIPGPYQSESMVRIFLLAMNVGMLFGLGACDTNLRVMTKSVPLAQEEGKVSPLAAKLSKTDCIDPDLEKLPKDITLTLCSGDLAQGTFVPPDLSNLTAANIKNGVTIAGVTGTYPSLATPLAGASGLSDLTSLAAATPAGSYEFFDSTGTRYTGAITDAAVISPTASDQLFATSLYRQFTVAGDVNLNQQNIKTGVAIFGVTGGYPSATHPLAGSDATADLDLATFNAKLKDTTSFEWFDEAGARYTNTGSAHIKPGLLAKGASIFGTTGTLDMMVSNFDLVYGDNRLLLSWTRTGGDGVIIVGRSGGSAITWSPVSGTNYTQGQNVGGGHSIFYKGSASNFATSALGNGIWYQFQIFAYNSDNGYSSGSDQRGMHFGVWDGVCGGVRNSCYDNTAALDRGTATTPSGKTLAYVTAGGSFKVWKDTGSDRILRANGLDAWAQDVNLNGKGFSGNDFTGYLNLVGRVCPPSVYIDDSRRTSSGNCLYYTEEPVAQALNAAGNSQSDPATLGLGDWSIYNTGERRWYVGNIKTCADRGMRLPTLFETTTQDTTGAGYPVDDHPAWAQGTGVPSHPGGTTWTASSEFGTSGYYWLWSGQMGYYGDFSDALFIRCVLP